MKRELRCDRWIGTDYPVYIAAEIGINHNGSIDLARDLIDAAVLAGCDAVKFQKRVPEICVPMEQRNVMRETPWGYISYMEYRERVEFGQDEYEIIDAYCRKKGITWFSSCWDEPSVDFIEQFNPPCYKVHSAAVTDVSLQERLLETGKPMILSTGMSTLDEVKAAVGRMEMENLLLCHANSTYPCPVEELNLRMIQTYLDTYPCPIGYSGHEVGLPTTAAAVALGACYIERHITLDRSMWGSDQAASVEPAGFKRLVKYIRVVEAALGDGVKRVYPGEEKARKRLRK